MVRLFRKPLVIMTPKSLLRNKDAASPLSEFTKGAFQTVIGEVDDEIEAEKVKRVIACSGKVYYDLVKQRDETRGRRRRDHPRRAALSVPAQGVRGRAEEVPERDRSGLVPGRAAEPGRLVLRRSTTSTRTCSEGQKLGYAGRAGFGVAGGRLLRTCTRSSRRRWSTGASASSRASCSTK